MNDISSKVYSVSEFNEVIAAMIRIYKFLEADDIDSVDIEEKIVRDRIKLILGLREEYSCKELLDFCRDYQVLHNKIVNQISELKKNIENSQKNKKIVANKIFVYEKINNLNANF